MENKRAFVGNASSEKQVSEAVKKEALKKLNEENSLKYVLATKEGRKFYWDLMAECGIYKISADNSGSWTYYNEGKRSVGLLLLARVTVLDASIYAQMANENKGD